MAYKTLYTRIIPFKKVISHIKAQHKPTIIRKNTYSLSFKNLLSFKALFFVALRKIDETLYELKRQLIFLQTLLRG